MKQKISDKYTEECPTQCFRCKKFYSGGSCLTYEPSLYPQKILKNYCKKCFDKIIKEEKKQKLNKRIKKLNKRIEKLKNKK